MISGALKTGINTTPIADGRLQGDQISFTVGNVNYTGRVSGNTMEGSRSAGSGVDWRAIRLD